MPDYKFDRLDLFIIYRYIENKELLKLLDEYNIDKIATAVPNIYFIGVFTMLSKVIYLLITQDI